MVMGDLNAKVGTEQDPQKVVVGQHGLGSAMNEVKGYPGEDCASDHVPVIATMRVKLRKMKITKTVKKLQIDLLRTDDEYTTQFQRHISEHMEGINPIDNVEDRYIKFRNALTSTT